MSLKDSIRDNKVVVIAAAALAIIIAALITLPSSKKVVEEPETISARAKLDPLNIRPETVTAQKEEPQESADLALSRKEAQNAPPAMAPPAEPASSRAASIKVDLPEEPEARHDKKPSEKIEKKTAAKTAVKASDKVQAKTRTPAEDTAVSAEQWAVNVASYPDILAARKFEASLKSAGYKAYTVAFPKNNSTWYRVRVGFYKTRAEAQKAGTQINAKFNLKSFWLAKLTKAETLKYNKQ